MEQYQYQASPQYTGGQYQPHPSSSEGSEEQKTLWVGDLDPYMDEAYVARLFSSTGNQVANVKIIKDRNTGMPLGYGFIEFVSHFAAKQVFESYSGREIPGAGKIFRLNWATFKKTDNSPDYSIFVGDLAPDVTDFMLMNTFASRFKTIRSAKVVTDPNTRMSRGYGFIKFADENEARRALEEMQGVYVGSRPIRLSHATHKRSGPGMGGSIGGPGPQQPPENENNTTVFVGGINETVDENALRSVFSQYGNVLNVRIPASNRTCGFVIFADRNEAQNAINNTNGMQIGTARVKVSWGKSQSRSIRPSQPQPMQNPYAAYWAQQGYGGYPGYGGYAGYGQQYGNPYAQYYNYYNYQQVPPAQQPGADGGATDQSIAGGVAPAVAPTAAPASAATATTTPHQLPDFQKKFDVNEENAMYAQMHMEQYLNNYATKAANGVVEEDGKMK